MIKLKRITMVLLSGLSMALGLHAQNFVLDLTTGRGGTISAPTMIAPGNNDDTWTVQLPGGGGATPRVCIPAGAWANNPQCGSSWISPNTDALGNPTNGAAGQYIYSTTFTVRQGNCLAQRVVLNISSIGGDNNIVGVRLNGNNYVLNPPQANDFAPLIGSSTITFNLAHFNNSSISALGTNTLSILVDNTTASPTGFNFCGDLTVHYNDPAFTLSTNTTLSSYYTVTATPNVAPPAGTSYGWYLEELDVSNNSLFFVSNPSNWWTPVTSFIGFDHTTTAYSGTVNTLPGSPTIGRFLYNRTYRLSRGSWSANCAYSGFTQIFRSVKSLNGESHIYILDTKPLDFSHLQNGLASTQEPVPTSTDVLAVYPNPSTGLFTVTLNDPKEGTVEVFDMLGKKVQSLRLNAGVSTYQVDLSVFAKGIYVLNIHIGGVKQTRKIMLE